MVVGATVEERGDDLAVRVGAVHDLLCDARAIVPGVDELELREAATGMRPATPDNTPCIGWTALEGVAAARRPLPQRHPLVAPDRGSGGRPPRPPPGGSADPGPGAGVTLLDLSVNGEAVRVAEGTTIADVVAGLLRGDDPKGVAVAVDRCVVPRSEWASTPVCAGSLVEVVTAAAGG